MHETAVKRSERTGTAAVVGGQLIPRWTLADHSLVTTKQTHLLTAAIPSGTTVGYICA